MLISRALSRIVGNNSLRKSKRGKHAQIANVAIQSVSQILVTRHSIEPFSLLGILPITKLPFQAPISHTRATLHTYERAYDYSMRNIRTFTQA